MSIFKVEVLFDIFKMENATLKGNKESMQAFDEMLSLYVNKEIKLALDKNCNIYIYPLIYL